MSIQSILKAALDPIAPVQSGTYEPDVENGAVNTYIVINYNSNPADFGDDEPAHEIHSVQVHLFCPSGVNSLSMRRDVRKAIVAAGFNWPAYTGTSDKDGQHHIFECEIAEAAGAE